MPFLLTSESWIPVRPAVGPPTDVGLIDALAGAHTLESVCDASPPVTLAIHRLLLAILHRTFGPANLDAWQALYTRGSFDSGVLGAYFAQHAEAFDLLHHTRPFYQVRGLTKLYKPNGIGRLILERSNYETAVNVFQHRSAEAAKRDALPLAEAARNLLALQGFAPGGLVKKKDEPGSASAGPLNRGAFVLVRGRTLFETLMLNLLVYSPDEGLPLAGRAREDLPAWEVPEPPRQLGAKEQLRRPRGWVDWLTWQSRRVELVVDAPTSRVTGIVYCVGEGLDDAGLTDPMLAYRVDKTMGLRAIDLSDDRAMWRDCHSLVRSVGADGARPATAVTQLGRVELRAVLGAQRRAALDVIGMRGDQAAIKLARHERLVLPSAVLADPEKVAAIGHATTSADEVGRHLGYEIRDAVRRALAPGGRDPDKDDVSRLTSTLAGERAYWSLLAVPFETFLDELGRREIDGAVETFFEHVRRSARDSLRLATDALGVGAAKLQGAAVAERTLGKSLRELVPIFDPLAPTPGGPS